MMTPSTVQQLLQVFRLFRDNHAGGMALNRSYQEAVRTVAQGEATCPPRFCKVLFKALAAANDQNKDERIATQFELTQRQRQLMSLVAMGLSNKEIAANLNLSEFTVKNHIYRVMKQVDAQSRQVETEMDAPIRARSAGSADAGGIHEPHPAVSPFTLTAWEMHL